MFPAPPVYGPKKSVFRAAQDQVAPALLLIGGAHRYDELPLSEREPLVRRRPWEPRTAGGLGRVVSIP
jgi:hypothetical protein